MNIEIKGREFINNKINLNFICDVPSTCDKCNFRKNCNILVSKLTKIIREINKEGLK